MRSLNFRRFLGSFGTGAWLWVFTFVSAVQALTYIFCQESALWWTETKEKINRLSLSWLHAWTTNRTGLAALPNAGPTSAPLHGPLPISNQSTCRSFSHCQGFVTNTPLIWSSNYSLSLRQGNDSAARWTSYYHRGQSFLALSIDVQMHITYNDT